MDLGTECAVAIQLCSPIARDWDIETKFLHNLNKNTQTQVALELSKDYYKKKIKKKAKEKIKCQRLRFVAYYLSFSFKDLTKKNNLTLQSRRETTSSSASENCTRILLKFLLITVFTKARHLFLF